MSDKNKVERFHKNGQIKLLILLTTKQPIQSSTGNVNVNSISNKFNNLEKPSSNYVDILGITKTTLNGSFQQTVLQGFLNLFSVRYKHESWSIFHLFARFIPTKLIIKCFCFADH